MADIINGISLLQSAVFVMF